MTASQGLYQLKITAAAQRSLSQSPPRGLPERIAWAAYEFINGHLLENPRRVGKSLDPPFHGTWSARRGGYRILYEIDQTARIVTVVGIKSRGRAYHHS